MGLNRALPVEEAIRIAEISAKEEGLDRRQADMFDVLSRSCPIQMIDSLPVVTMDDFRSFMLNFKSAVKNRDSSYFRVKRGLCVPRIVDIEEFIDSHEYLNQSERIRPAIRKEVLRLYEPGANFIEAVLTGGIGIGKEYFSFIVLAYEIYKLSCYHDPQSQYGLAPGSSIVFIGQSKTHTLAKKVIFNDFKTVILDNSPYFQHIFPYDKKIASELRFPKNIYMIPVGGSDTSAIGMNVFGGMIDEMNFMARTKDSVHVQHMQEEEYDQAEQLYRVISRRMKSRFIQKGGSVPGKLLLVSSVNYPGDFTDRKVEEAKEQERKGNPMIFVMHYAHWESIPLDNLSEERFLVEVGNELKQSRIVESMEDAVDQDDVIEVPEDYRVDFERDIEAALRDYAGIATGTKSPFIPQRELIAAAQDEHHMAYEGQSLFTRESCVLSHILDINSPDWELLVNQEYIENCLLVSPTVPFAAHIDVGLGRNDAAGFAVGHISGYKMLPSVRIYDERHRDFREVRDIRAPIYTIDGVLQVTAPPNGEVDLELLRDLALYIRSLVFLKWGTVDHFQYAMFVQSFRKAGLRSGKLSMDTDVAPYAEVKQAIKDGRLLFPRHSVAAYELRELERDPKKDKIDHPEGGSKDCSDAIAGVTYILQRKEAQYGHGGGRRKRTPTAQRAKDAGGRHVRVGRRLRG